MSFERHECCGEYVVFGHKGTCIHYEYRHSEFERRWLAEDRRLALCMWATGFRVTRIFGQPPTTAEGIGLSDRSRSGRHHTFDEYMALPVEVRICTSSDCVARAVWWTEPDGNRDLWMFAEPSSNLTLLINEATSMADLVRRIKVRM